jgi:hypothetical protein
VKHISEGRQRSFQCSLGSKLATQGQLRSGSLAFLPKKLVLAPQHRDDLLVLLQQLGKMDAISLGGAPSGRLPIMRPMWFSFFWSSNHRLRGSRERATRLGYRRQSRRQLWLCQARLIWPSRSSKPPSSASPWVATAPWLAKASSRGDKRPAQSI